MNVKIVTRDNWLKADPTSAILMKIDKGIPSSMTGEDWVEIFSAPQLSENVPENVRELFEVARGSFAYGYYFYPLATLACEQLFRVAETAVTDKCKAVGAPKGKTRVYKDKIQYLFDNGFISNAESESLHGFRKMRNKASHPERQLKLPIGILYPFLERITEITNKLFSGLEQTSA
jgi:hypothetical protein